MKLDSKRRETLSKLLSNLAVFWLTALPVSVLTNLGIDTSAIVPMIVVACVGIGFAIWSVIISKDEEKPTNDIMHTEVKKGIFHIGNAEIRKAQ